MSETAQNHKKVIVSGMRPTGYLHLGHFHGVIENWVQLQQDSQYSFKFFFVADWHSLTTEYANTAQIKDFSKELIIDWLAYGVDPQKATIFVQSAVPEHAELHLLLSMITPVSWLERVPSYKDLQKELKGKDLSTYGFLGYPLLQTADVAIYNATHIPVGQDQVAHIEFSREVVRRFNHIYQTELLPEPQPVLTNFPKVPGLDGRKMSKSYNNSIYLKDSEDEASKKIMPMMTDPARVRRTDPGNPEVCPVFDYHKLYSSDENKNEVIQGCTTAGMGCVDCKKMLLKNMNETLNPFREKRRELEGQPQIVDDVIQAGNQTARQVAQENLQKVRDVFHV